MNRLDFERCKKITIMFSDYREIKFALVNFDEEELEKIISQFNKGDLMEIRNIFVNPKNINYFQVDDLEEEDLQNERLD